MKNAYKSAYIKSVFVALFLAVALVLPGSTWATAGSPQICTVGESCIVGEFLYDDEYTPITTGICNITSRYPDGTLYLNNQSMPAATENDGWYSYEITAPSTTGSYRTQMCCTVNTELICVDKTFDVVEASAASADDVATAVWGYSDRSLSSFGSLVTDIWGYSSRTLSSFETLIRDIWISEENTTTIADGTDGDLDGIKKTVDENRLLLEQLVNKPIIENFLEEETIDLSEKIRDTRGVTNQMYVNNQYLTAKSVSMATVWNRESSTQLLDNMISLNDLLGEETDSSSTDTVFGSINWIRQAWGWERGDEIYTKTTRIKKDMNSIQAALASNSSNDSSYKNIRQVVKNLVELEKIIGSATDSIEEETLYGQINQVEKHIAVLNERDEEVDKLLVSWKEVKESKDTKGKINDIQRKLIAINKVPKASQILSAKRDGEDPTTALKNRLLSFKGVINANKKLLALGAGDSLSSTWLEEGSIVFKTLATNPSKLIAQDVEIKYYLPQEIREEDVISMDEGLEVKYEAENDKYYVEGKFNLAAGESRTFSVKTEDIWEVTDTEIASIRKQAEELSRPLEKTSFFAQGVTLKSDIDASLNRIVTLQENAVTPEQKIRAYREAAIEKQSAEEKLSSLQDLVTQAGSTGTLFGFVGGAQTLAVWGMIIIMTIGFVFLALYMRTVTSSKKKKKIKDDETKGEGVVSIQPRASSNMGNLGKVIKYSAPFVFVAIVSAVIAGIVVSRSATKSVKDEVLGQRVEVVTKEVNTEEVVDKAAGYLEEEEENAIGGLDIVWLDVPNGSSVDVKEGPSAKDEVVVRVRTAQEVIRIDEVDGWASIMFMDENALEIASEAWVSTEFIAEPTLERISDIDTSN